MTHKIPACLEVTYGGRDWIIGAWIIINIPRCLMYGIFAYIWQFLMVNVGKYRIPYMDPMGCVMDLNPASSKSKMDGLEALKIERGHNRGSKQGSLWRTWIPNKILWWTPPCFFLPSQDLCVFVFLAARWRFLAGVCFVRRGAQPCLVGMPSVQQKPDEKNVFQAP